MIRPPKHIASIVAATLLLSAAGVASLHAGDPEPAAEHSDQLTKSVAEAWGVSWSRFYRNDTHLFYDYLTSYDTGRELDHLPTSAEVERQFPNDCGYGTGMEDCMISAGVMLSMIVDRYQVTNEESMRNRAHGVFRGIQLCAKAHGKPGFLARGVCHEHLKSIYLNSSRDQYTHAVHGLWHYARSSLCSAETKREVSEIISCIADRMTRNVIAANDYDSLRADGTRDKRGINRMWNVKGHEAARLPMIYAAAWDVTDNQKYRELWRKYAADAVEQSFHVEDWQATYAFLQMQISLELLAEMEPNPDLERKMQELMTSISKRCEDRAIAADKRANGLDLTQVCTDWRTGEGISSGGSYRKIWYCIREGGEAALAQLVGDNQLSNEQQQILERSLNRLDYDRVSSNGIFYLQAAYWKSRPMEH